MNTEVTFCTKCKFRWDAPVRDSKGNHLTIFYCPKCGHPIVWCEQTYSKDERTTTIGTGNQSETVILHRILFPVPVPSITTEEERLEVYETLENIQENMTKICEDKLRKWFEKEPDVNELKKQLMKKGEW